MIDVYQLGLPCPSDTLLDAVKKLVEQTSLSKDSKQWLDEQNNINNSAEHLFFVNQDIDVLIQQEFGKFFVQDIGGVIGIMKTSDGFPACQPPHIDRGRALAINYYVDLGGNNVETVFYDITDQTMSQKSKNYTYQEVKSKKSGSVVFDKNQWYAFDVCQCHSIENIIGTRYFVSIRFKDEQKTVGYRVADLAKDYSLLITRSVTIH